MKKIKVTYGGMLIFSLFVLILGVVIGSMFPFTGSVKTEEKHQPIEIAGEKTVEMTIPAVDVDGNGVVGKLITRIRPGNGQVLVNINNVLAQFDTQFSGRTAAKAASELTKKSLDNLDITYDIQANASVIEGPSAGAAMAASIVLGLEDIEANSSITITGKILDNGTIDQVGSVLEKGRAAKENGASIFLVPVGEGTELKTERIRTCKQIEFAEFCQIKYNYNSISIGRSLNMTVIEVGNLEEAVSIFRQYSNKRDVKT